jgi:hypothetical protein
MIFILLISHILSSYRYETNVIYPPVYAGTCHVSPIYGVNDMVGGAFRANLAGVTHYEHFGYKAKLQSPTAFQQDLQESSSWMTVSYRWNRGILHDGDFPHLSSEIEYIKPSLRRVILGFNVFTDDVGECNLRAPEHSEAFNRTIKLYQSLAAAGVSITSYLSDASHSAADNDNHSRYCSGTESTPSSNTSSDQPIVMKVTDNMATVYSDLTTGHNHTESSSQSNSTTTGAKGGGGGVSIQEVLKNPVLARLIVQAAKKAKQTTVTPNSLPPAPPETDSNRPSVIAHVNSNVNANVNTIIPETLTSEPAVTKLVT